MVVVELPVELPIELPVELPVELLGVEPHGRGDTLASSAAGNRLRGSATWHGPLGAVRPSPSMPGSSLSALNLRHGRQRGFYSEVLEAAAQNPAGAGSLGPLRASAPRQRLRRDPKAWADGQVRSKASLFVDLSADGPEGPSPERMRSSPLHTHAGEQDGRPPRFPGFKGRSVLGEPRVERRSSSHDLWEQSTVLAPPKMLGGERGGPLSILADRRRRVFTQLDVAALLEEEGVTSETLVGHFVTLDAFDDLELETRTAAEWTAYGAAVHASDAEGAPDPEMEPVGGPIFITLTDELLHAAAADPPPADRALRVRCLPDVRDAKGRWTGDLVFHDACILEWLSDSAHVRIGGYSVDASAAGGQGEAGAAARRHARKNG
ncbi:hypothetical protein T492DRAFT_859698 [Pavlovales sp. CCMP2436]|nr:hypothetical protein T492DRAFT_859698 [Pavlovales sp. CCMP2436]